MEFENHVRFPKNSRRKKFCVCLLPWCRRKVERDRSHKVEEGVCTRILWKTKRASSGRASSVQDQKLFLHEEAFPGET